MMDRTLYPDRSEGPWGRAVKPLARRCCAERRNLDTARGVLKAADDTNDGRKPSDAIEAPRGQAPSDKRPWSRTGENPPYGILGGTMETSASFEARSSPSSYPCTIQSLGIRSFRRIGRKTRVCARIVVPRRPGESRRNFQNRAKPIPRRFC
jgi:hypothetical protein